MSDRRRWTILAVGTAAQAATCCFMYGIPMLVPALRAEGASLFEASLVVSAPIVGILLTLIAWGAAADRNGERIVIDTGLGLSAVVLGVAAVVAGIVGLSVMLAVAGAFGASVNAASGRVVMGWFPPAERGLAMGTRQTAQPLGVALAALALPPLAHAHGPHLALLFPAVLCAVAAVAVYLVVADPPRPPRVAGAPPVGSPYRGSRTLLRVHLASALLVVPQFAVAAFTLVYLVGQRHWDPAVAGRMIFAFQVAGAAGRVLSGVWSDRVRSRLVPMRQLAVASAALMFLIALGAATDMWFVIVGFGLGALITVADNGLAYTAVAELAGREWSGRALGVQNTVQNIAAVATSPLLAVAIGESRYALGFELVAIFPLLAIGLTPVRAERWGGADDSGRQDVPAGNVLAREAANRAGLDASGDLRREKPDMG
ncbi:MAG: major facilitator transporter [Jatrophihabitans sp.]|nr:major facilitator transporter [Jatrophihabitans sp.]